MPPAGRRISADAYRFELDALHGLALADTCCESTLLGRPVAAPVLVPAGTDATERQPPGSPRPLPPSASASALDAVQARSGVRRRAPATPLLLSLAARDFVGVDDCRRLVDRAGADALELRLDVLAQGLRPDGSLRTVERLCSTLDHPVVIGGLGAEIADDVLGALVDAGAAGVAVGAAGDALRRELERLAPVRPWEVRVAAAFHGARTSVADTVARVQRVAAAGSMMVMAPVRDGVDVAKAIALGVDAAMLPDGFAPGSPDTVEDGLQRGGELVAALRAVMLCAGARSLAELRRPGRLRRDRSGGGLLHREVLQVQTAAAGQFVDITDSVVAAVARSGVREGQVHVFSHHTTAAIRINEAEPLLLADFRRFLEQVAPAGGYLHDDMRRRLGLPPDEPVNGHSHCRHLLLSSSEVVPASRGSLVLGQWQRIFLIELCSSRERRVTVQVGD